MIDSQKVKFISDLINARDLVFFTGAGISLAPPANLMMFSQLQNDIIWALHQSAPEVLKRTYEVIHNEIRNSSRKSDIANKFMNVPPEYIFELCKTDTLCDDENDAYYALEPLNTFRNAIPNLNHLHLAHFLLTGYVPAVLTTNFDLLIESGIDRLSQNINDCIRISKHWKDEQFRRDKYASGQYFKLHGCIEDSESIAMSLSDIGKRCINQLPALKYYLENYHVFFIGYRGADLDIFSYLATTECKGIIWNGHTENAIIPKVKYLLKKHKAAVVIGDVSEILEMISTNLGLSKLTLNETTHFTKVDYINEFILWAKKIEPISIITILGDIWNYVGKQDEALTCYRFGYSLAQNKYDKYTENVVLGRLASFHYQMKDYREAKKYCNFAIKNAKNFPIALQLYEYVHSVQLLGLIDHGNLMRSLTLFRRALHYQEQLEKIYPPARCKKADILSNIANALRKCGYFDDSVNCCKSALEIYDEFGDVQGRAAVLACIGNILFEQEKWDECLDYYKEAEYLFNETGNIYKLAKICHAIARTDIETKDSIEARRYAKRSLLYSEIIADQEGYNRAIRSS